MVLVDSNIWVGVEHQRLQLRELIGNEDIAACPMVVHEVLRGARNAERVAIARAMFQRVEMYDDPTPLERFEEAARIYWICRDGGVTPATVDCLIAACAIAHNIPVLTFDTDFTHIARYTALRLFTRS